MIERDKCPFCGESSEMASVGGDRFCAFCIVCRAEGPIKPTSELAADAWNAPAKRIAELEKAVENAVELGRLSVIKSNSVNGCEPFRLECNNREQWRVEDAPELYNYLKAKQEAQ